MLQLVPSMIRYTDFRLFLKDLFYAEQAQSRAISIKSFAKSVQMSPSAFHMILSGKRNLTVHYLHLIASKLKLQRWEREYFESMVLNNQAESEDEAAFYLARIKKLREQQQDLAQKVRVSDSTIATQWFTPALLIYLTDKLNISQGDLNQLPWDEISEYFGKSKEEIIEAVEKLKEQNFLCFSASQKLHIQFDKLIKDITTYQYTHAISKVGVDRMEKNFGNQQCFFSTYSLTMSRKLLPRFVDDYKELLEKYLAEDISQLKDLDVFVVNLQTFPINTH